MPRALAASILAALSIAAGCGGDSTAHPPDSSALQGTWMVCQLSGAQDERRAVTFSGSAVTVEWELLASTDSTCAGQPSLQSVYGTTFAVGADVAATLGAASVTAQAIDFLTDPVPLHTIVYVDGGAAPKLLYLGDLSADAGLDGSAPAKRPTALDAAWPHAKQ